MKKYTLKPVLWLAGAAVLLMSPLAISHFDDKAIPQSYRQSCFTIMAMNFGPMAAMVKGEMPWDQAAFQNYSQELATMTSLNLMRGFPPGSGVGKTKAKPDIWDNKADFEAKFEDLRNAASSLQQTAAAGDREAIVEQFKATGGACKACHDEYKAENYLN